MNGRRERRGRLGWTARLCFLLVLPGFLVVTGCGSSSGAPEVEESESGISDGDGTSEPGATSEVATGEDTDVSDGPRSERPGTTDPDATDPDATDPDATDPDATDPDATDSDPTDTGPDEPVNACGGTGELQWQGAAGELLAPCGAFDEGTLVCGGLDALRCAGEQVAVNICGGQGVLPAEVGSPCGACGDGTWVCGSGGDSVRCLGASSANVCGGCARLDEAPGAACLIDDEEGAWVCTDVDEQTCVAGAVNACGGQGALMHDGEASAPGASCSLACGSGVLRCDGPEGLVCVSDDSGEPENACGGCGPLAGEPGSGCGACEDGVWTCDEGQVFCGGGTNANACGGCDVLAGEVGEPCDDGLAWGCSGPELQCFVPLDTDVRNACGGTGTLTGAPGEACGTCSAGVLVCDSPEVVECSVPNSAQVNACGGCGGLGGRLHDPCGTCGSGSLACDGDVLICAGDLGEAAENSCGGCSDLPGEPDEECGPCRTWVCNDRGGVRCIPTETLPGCMNLETCASLDCAGQRRACIEATDTEDAICSDCLAGYAEQGGVCELAIGAPQNVDATRGTRMGDVLVTWSEVEHATGYHVFRNGSRATESPVTIASWQDALAPAAGPPNVVTGLAATTDRADGILLTWDPATVHASATTYTVAAVIGDDFGPTSDSAEGYRGGAPVTRYEVRIGDGAWQSIGNTDSWLDEEAQLATIPLAAPSASTDRDDGIALAMEGPAVQATVRAYRIRAVNQTGESAASSAAEGHLGFGALSYQWEWSNSSTGEFTVLAGASALTHLDSTVDHGSTRWYRLRAQAPGAETTTSESAEGQRLLLGPGRECADTAQCDSGLWCSTNTSERRCSPRPSIGGVQLPFQWVPRGTFTMGSPAGEVGRNDSREGQVEVTLTRDYFMQRTPVTQGQWSAVMAAWNALPDAERTMSGWSGATPVFGTNPALFGSAGTGACSSATCPVERVSWWDAVVFANALSILEGLEPCYTLSECRTGTGIRLPGGGCSGDSTARTGTTFECSSVSFAGKSCTGYRLPTEAEWERAARAGTTTATYLGNLTPPATICTDATQANLDPIAWWCGNSGSRTRAVGGRAPNAWGFHDILGNVLEWTWARYADAHSGGTDPLGPSDGSTRRVLRGGSWPNSAQVARAASRVEGDPETRSHNRGLRLARTAP